MSEENKNGLMARSPVALPQPEQLPEPTACPMLFALGITMIAFGVVTSWIISATGLLVFIFAASMWVEELRNDQLQ
jgi:hypothetical protein